MRAGDLESGKAGELESMRPGELETLIKDSLARIPQPVIFKKTVWGLRWNHIVPQTELAMRGSNGIAKGP